MDIRIEKLNELLKRHAKAELYMDCPHLKGAALEKAIAEREVWLPTYIELLKEIKVLWDELGLGENG